MPRNNRPKKSRKNEEPEELNVDLARRSSKRIEIKRGNHYVVQPTTGTNAEPGKSWTCPHCNRTIMPGTAHLVAWEDGRELNTRRHFHTNCWAGFNGEIL